MATLSQLQALGNLIRSRRKDLDLTLEQVEKRSGVVRGWLSNIEKAYVRPLREPVTPSDEVLGKIAVALDIPIVEMHQALGRFDDNTIIYEPDDEVKVVMEAFNGGNDNRNTLVSVSRGLLAKKAMDAARAGAIGRRADDDEDELEGE